MQITTNPTLTPQKSKKPFLLHFYEKKKISYEKLQYLLSLSNLEPSDVGITEPQSFTPPSDDELDDIMGE